MATTKEIVGELIDVNQELEYLEQSNDLDIDKHKELEETRLDLHKQVKVKLDNVDYFMVELSKREHIIDAEIEHMKDEVARLKSRRKGLERTKDYFNKTLLPSVILEVGNDNGVYETNTARYKLYETFGSVMVDPHIVADDFKKVEIVEKLDKVKARKAAISAFNAGEDMPIGIDITKVKRVKRT
jgi:hypothetical protein|tara:strand:+ start:534 stop:1088 length:555 start_codon:yes stop_codon:yes gene_type:complete